MLDASHLVPRKVTKRISLDQNIRKSVQRHFTTSWTLDTAVGYKGSSATLALEVVPKCIQLPDYVLILSSSSLTAPLFLPITAALR